MRSLRLTHNPSHLSPPQALDWRAAFDETESFWLGWAARCTYAGPRREPVLRSLLTLKALTYAETGESLRPRPTSLPEQLGGQRNWDYRYCWLRDATLTLTALLSAGYREEAQAWRAWLQRSVGRAPRSASNHVWASGRTAVGRMGGSLAPWISGRWPSTHR